MNQLILITLIVLLLWLTILTWHVHKIGNHYRKLTKDTKKESLMDALTTLMDQIQRTTEQLNETGNRVEQLTKDTMRHVQNVSIVRFNPFADTGGDQSFVLAILDALGTGVVLTSLHTRGMTRWYAKKIKEGKGEQHELSQEEKRAILEARMQKRENRSERNE